MRPRISMRGFVRPLVRYACAKITFPGCFYSRRDSVLNQTIESHVLRGFLDYYVGSPSSLFIHSSEYVSKHIQRKSHFKQWQNQAAPLPDRTWLCSYLYHIWFARLPPKIDQAKKAIDASWMPMNESIINEWNSWVNVGIQESAGSNKIDKQW